MKTSLDNRVIDLVFGLRFVTYVDQDITLNPMAALVSFPRRI